MHREDIIKNLKVLFIKFSRASSCKIEEIPHAVSSRKYFRIFGPGKTLIGTYSPDKRETAAFLSFSSVFRSLDIMVPEVYEVSDEGVFYLQEDLGDTRLHELVVRRNKPELDGKILNTYKSAIDQLVRLQIESDKEVNYALCVPRSTFDRQSVMWDLYHFKYYFLKLSGISFDEQILEDAFLNLADSITAIKPKGFMFRDFQSRNIIIKDDKTYLIDFQGGRKGPLLYDIASLVFEAKASLTDADRDQLVRYYLDRLAVQGIDVTEKNLNGFYLMALIRILQALGAYGLRGKIEKRAVFIQSIPAGLSNLEKVVNQVSSVIDPYLYSLLLDLSKLKSNYQYMPEAFSGLTVTIYSFSYRKPVPDDITGNGGGFVYDCRFLKNPGKFDAYRDLTGLQKPVSDFLEKQKEVIDYIDLIKSQLKAVVKSYQKRNYHTLMVAFGCTGGRHRSVYTAHKIADWLSAFEGLKVIEIHREL
ncbi:MAG TPA: RNase adapter RapZ [Bacteroidales bacterium]|nr:RNase adapter RapZ [Bacteroidales bacterium]